MIRTALRLLLLAGVLTAAAIGTGLAIAGPFVELLEEGAGSVRGFSASTLVRVHAHLGHASALVALPLAATGLLLGLHGLLATSGRRLPSALLAVAAPVGLFWALGAVYTGHAAWEPTLLGELQPEVLHGFLGRHGRWFALGAGLAVLVQGGLLLWLRGRRREEEEEDEGLA